MNKEKEIKTYTCPACKDTGIFREGHAIAEIIFCKCDAGDESFEGWADGQSQLGMEGEYHMEETSSGGDYWQNEAGEYCCG
jgi:hypothetical protein|tara:strand:- start:2017 stop:2259 length:243 start_codon:yes stop_codon:yes gene_type:complete